MKRLLIFLPIIIAVQLFSFGDIFAAGPKKRLRGPTATCGVQSGKLYCKAWGGADCPHRFDHDKHSFVFHPPAGIKFVPGTQVVVMTKSHADGRMHVLDWGEDKLECEWYCDGIGSFAHGYCRIDGRRLPPVR